MMQMTDVVKNLIIINVIMFVGTMMLPAEIRSSLALYFPLSEFFKPYQLVSHLFMHGDLMHLAFNMYGLYLFGSALEALWGPKKFLIFYLLTGFGAMVLSLGVKYLEYQYAVSSLDPQLVQMVFEKGGTAIAGGKNYVDAGLANLNGIINYSSWGASGSIFGLLAGYAMNFPNNKLGIFPLPFYLEAKYFVFIYGAIELFLGVGSFNTGIAHFAHLGGAIFGILIILYWKKNGSRF